MSDQLIATKLHPPGARPNLVPRPRLLARLAAGLHGRLTLLSAPPGYGKSTLLAEWLHHFGLPISDFGLKRQPDNPQSQIQNPKFAWLSLDEGDNDPLRFWGYVCAAVEGALPGAARVPLALLQLPQPPPAAAIVTALLNGLSDPAIAGDAVLVLDDYHVITLPALHQQIEILLERLPPRLRLVIASRTDPPLSLTRLRVRGELTEIREPDLRFSPAEAAHFLTVSMGLEIGPIEIAAIEARTEGWAAGLQLAAIAMRNRGDRAQFIAAFSGSHRFVVDYLAAEVLARQPEPIRHFLLQTSILDRMCGPLCDVLLDNSSVGKSSALGSRPSSAGQAILEELERANLFVIPMDDERRWYRYHHLFADAMRDRLPVSYDAAAIAALHRRAGVWLAGQGLFDEAVEHLLAAGESEEIAALVARNRRSLFASPVLQRQVEGWLSRLPIAMLRSWPALAPVRASICINRFDTDGAERLLREAERLLPPLPAGPADGAAIQPPAGQEHEEDWQERTGDLTTLRGEIAALHAVVAGLRGESDQALAAGAVARRLLGPADPTAFSAVSISVGYAHLAREEYRQAGAAFAEAAEAGRTAGSDYAVAIGDLSLIAALRAQGRQHEALALCRRALARAEVGSPAAAAGISGLYGDLADLLREQNDLDAALHYAEIGVTRSRQWVNEVLLVLNLLVLARVWQARGDLDAALVAVEQARAEASPTIARQVLPLLDAFTLQLRLRRGDAAAARAILERDDWSQPLPLGGIALLRVFDYEHRRLIPAHALIALGHSSGEAGPLWQALDMLEDRYQRATATGLLWLRVKARALQARARHALGDMPAARAALAEAVTLAAPAGYVRLFADEGEPIRWQIAACRLQTKETTHPESHLLSYIDSLLRAFPGAAPVAAAQATSYKLQSAMIEPLTHREQEILALIAAGASNREIAEQLVISLGTVKKHLNNIFGKLGASSRTQALAQARTHGLLP